MVEYATRALHQRQITESGLNLCGESRFPRRPGWRLGAIRHRHIRDISAYQCICPSRHAYKSTAQEEEIRLARSRSCNHGVGGGGPEQGAWCVYSFDY